MDREKFIIKEYKKGTPVNEISAALQVSENTVFRIVRKLKIAHPNRNGKISNRKYIGNMEDTMRKTEALEAVKRDADLLIAKTSEVKATKKYAALLCEYNALRKKFDELTEYRSRVKVAKQVPNIKSSKNSHAVPFLVLSDWHVEEEVKPRTIGGKNQYTLEIARKRSESIFQNAVKRVMELKAEVNTDTMALFLLGDFITGHIHEENVENAQLGKLDALQYAEELLTGGIEFLLKRTKLNLNIYCKVGNHSRTTERVRASTEWQNSVEPMMYWSMRRHFETSGRVKFHMEESYLSIVDILGTRVRFHHGHAVSYGGGVGGLHIPLRKAIKSWNENERADLDIMGHYHNYSENSTLRYIVNGSLIGYNAYAERIKAPLEKPLQAFGIIHSKFGYLRASPLYAE